MRAASPPTYTWPKIAHDSSDTGVSADPGISTSNASKLGVRWMKSTGVSVLSSPVVAWNATLSKTLVYLGNEAGYLTAYDEATGAIVWSVNLGSAIRDTPLVENGNLWVSPTFNPALYKLNAATGAVECSAPGVSVDNSSATFGTPKGGTPTVYIAYLDQGTQSGPVEAIDEATCKEKWAFTDFVSTTGAWDPLSFANDAHGRSLVLFGTSDPDQRVYAIDARTGALVWDFQIDLIPGSTDTDVGTGVSVTAPGVNGFPDGMGYVTGRNGYAYGLDLTTGALVWKNHFATLLKGPLPWSRSTPAVDGRRVIFGETTGALCLDAVDGHKIWEWNNGNSSGGSEVLSAMAVVGPRGGQVAAMASLNGGIDVLSVSTGKVLYRYGTGAWSDSSVADVDGHLLETSSDGFLYDFAVGGANGVAPTTQVTAPPSESTIAYPGPSIRIQGTATASGSDVLGGVDVSVQKGGTSGPWWDGASGSWVNGFASNRATLAVPGQTTSSWSYALPVPPAGGVYRVLASAVDANGLADISSLATAPSSAQTSFTVQHSLAVPKVYSATGVWAAPGSAIIVDGSGFAPGETVDLSLGATSTPLSSVVASPSGAIHAPGVVIPATAAFGPASLVATGETSGKSTSAPIEVSNAWTESGLDNLNSGNEPNDGVFAHHVSPTHSQFLEQVWSYPTGAGMRTTPAVQKGVLYAANDLGSVIALNVHNSQPIWTVSVSQGGSGGVDSSPALGDGLVIFVEACCARRHDH